MALTSGRTATTLARFPVRRVGSIARVTITVAEPTTVSERNVVGASDSLSAPRHLDGELLNNWKVKKRVEGRFECAGATSEIKRQTPKLLPP